MTAEEREAWLARRRGGIGGSDAPNLIGVGYGTAAQVWLEKQGVAPEKKGGWLQRGLDLEPVVAQKYEEIMGTPLMMGEMVWAPNAWQFATLDRVRKGDGRPVELKTVAGFTDDWGPNGTDLIPAVYRTQVQHQLGVAGADVGDLIALDVVTWEARVYRVEFDPGYFEWLTGVERTFFEDYVRPKVLPPIGWEEQHAENALLKRVIPGCRFQIGEDLAAALERRERLLKVKKEAEARLDDIDRLLAEQMDGAEAAEGGGWRVKRTLIPGARVEYDRKPSVRTTITRAK